MLALAAARRAAALADAFVAMVRAENPLAAIPLVRMQLDTAMRFNARSLAENPDKLLEQFETEEPWSKLKARDGRSQLTDRYLHEQLAGRFPWASRVYKATSGFVHFSGPALLQAITERSPDGAGGERVKFDLGPKGRPWTRFEQQECADAFLAATDAVSVLIEEWKEDKPRLSDAGAA
jgi:hypothetical protein